MNAYLYGFKNEILDTIYKIAGKVWVKIIGAYAFYVGINTAFVAIGALLLVNFKNFSDVFSNTMDIKEILRNFSQELSPAIMLSVIVYSIVMAIIMSWSYYFSFLIINSQIKEDKVNFVELLFKSFSSGTLKMMGLNLLFYMFLIAGILLSIFVFSKISVVLSVLSVIAFLIFCLRFILVVPAFLIGSKTLSESINYSFRNITWGRTFRIFGIIIVAMIVVIIASFFLGLIMLIFKSSVIASQIFNIMIQIFIGGTIMTFFVTASLGLYYRFSYDEEKTDGEIPIDDLLVSKQQ